MVPEEKLGTTGIVVEEEAAAPADDPTDKEPQPHAWMPPARIVGLTRGLKSHGIPSR
jgi:hypothetical protein